MTSSSASVKRWKLSSGNFASTGMSAPSSRMTASTRSPLRNPCWSVNLSAGRTSARSCLSSSSPTPPRAFGGRSICSKRWKSFSALVHLRGRLADLAETLVHAGRRLGHAREAAVDLDVHLAEAAVDLRVELAEAAVHRLGHADQAPVDLGVSPCQLLGALVAMAREVGAQHAHEPDGADRGGGDDQEDDDGPEHGPTNSREGVGRMPEPSVKAPNPASPRAYRIWHARA